MRTIRLLVHQMFVGHSQQRGVIPVKYRRCFAGQPLMPSTLPACQRKDLDAVMELREVDNLYQTGTARNPAGNLIPLQRLDELPVSRLFFGGHHSLLTALIHE